MSREGVARVYSVANALMCSTVSRSAQPLVFRTDDRQAALDLIREVATLAGLPVTVQDDLDGSKITAGPMLVVVTGGRSDADIVKVAGASADVHIAVLVDNADMHARLTSIGQELIAGGRVEVDDELAPHQQVPSSLI